MKLLSWPPEQMYFSLGEIQAKFWSLFCAFTVLQVPFVKFHNFKNPYTSADTKKLPVFFPISTLTILYSWPLNLLTKSN